MTKASTTFLLDGMKNSPVTTNSNDMLYINQYQCFQFFIWFFAIRASINTVQFWLCFGPSLPLQFIRLNDKRAKLQKNKFESAHWQCCCFVKHFIYTRYKNHRMNNLLSHRFTTFFHIVFQSIWVGEQSPFLASQ